MNNDENAVLDYNAALTFGLPVANLADVIDQTGVRPGKRKLQQFIEALELRGTPKLYEQDGKGKEAIAYVKLCGSCQGPSAKFSGNRRTTWTQKPRSSSSKAVKIDMTNYIGKSGRIAAVLFKQLDKLKTTPDVRERRLMFTGPPGVGKTTMAEELASALTGEDIERIRAGVAVNVEVLNGQSVTVEIVRKWQEASAYRSIFGDVRVIIIDEADAITSAALGQIRTYLDRIPKGVVIIATTNLAPNELQPQLQGRFKLYYFDKVPQQEIATWLVKKFKLPAMVALETAERCDGSPRTAELDALSINEVTAAT